MNRGQNLIFVAGAFSALLLVFVVLDSAVRSDETTVSKVAATRQAIFDIPFRVNTAAGSHNAPIEAQLWVSVDYGKHWDLYSRVKPSAARFTFHAGVDGEYWFRIQTVGRSGTVVRDGGNKPGLRVIVDTTIPQVALDAYRGQGGQVTAVWRIEELNLESSTLSLQYRTSETSPWQPVALGLKNRQGGYVTWIPQEQSDRIEVRLEVNDRAGNSAIRCAWVVASPVLPTGATVTDNSQVNPLYGTTPGKIATDPAPAVSNLFVNRAEKTEEKNDPNGNFRSTISIRPAASGRTGGGTTGGAQGPIAMTARAADSPISVLPDGEQLRMVNSRRFTIHYEIMPACPSGIRRVELFCTRDGGLTWRSHQLDSDKRSPMHIYVKAEGVYGFRMVVRSRAGQGGREPRSGDLPELSVGVDLTEPRVEIDSIEAGVGVERGKVVLHWQAHDRLLSARPISIYYGRTIAGPWIPLVKGLENTGRFACSTDKRMQGGYFRIEARDEAGNVGASDVIKAASLGAKAPSIRIRDAAVRRDTTMGITAERRVGRSSY